MKITSSKKIITLGIASLLTLSVLTSYASSKTSEIPTSHVNEKESLTSPQSTSPTGPRKIVVFEGNRYVFLNDGEVFQLTSNQLGSEIARQYNGTFYELKGFNPKFRMAFQSDNAYYICENVGKSDDSAMNLQAYLETANLKTHVMYGDIFDLFGAHILNSLNKEATDKVLDVLNQAQIANLTEEDHESIAKAQSEGLCYLLEFTLDDYTTFKSYIIPSMNYITIGDYTCIVEDLESQIGIYFENLEVPKQTIMN